MTVELTQKKDLYSLSTPEFLGIIKKEFRFGSLTWFFTAHPSESQNPAFVEIDSATAGMNALVQNDSSVNGLA